jgi:hypothetical protein
MPPGEVSSRNELEQLSERITELERRISVLEHPSELSSPWAKAAVPPLEPYPTLNGSAAELQGQPSILAVLGTAVLGIAGAYVLRAVAESRVLGSWIPVTVALLYAAAWLIWAAQPRVANGIARNCYAITSALILAPLLWETTVRFQMFAPPVVAGMLVVFAALATALAWRTKHSAIAWTGVLTAVITGLILIVATRALLPFSVSLLAMAPLIELTGIRGRWAGLRPIVAAAVDFAVLLVVLILGDTAAIPSDYHAVRPASIVAVVGVLFAIYVGSVSIRSLIFRLKIGIFEMSQVAATVLLASWAVLRVTNGAGRTALGAAFLVAGAAGYLVSFGVLAQHRERPNFYFYSTCGVVFVIIASFLALPSAPLVISLSSAALVATALGVYSRSPALDLHGVAYLAGAVTASGLLDYAGRALAGDYPGFPRLLPILAALAALACAATISRCRGEHLGGRTLRLLPAILAVYAIAALAVAALVWLVAHGSVPTRPQLAVIRTMVTSAAALVLVLIGARWHRRELVWIAYAAVVFGSLKLAFEDLRFGTSQSLAVSLLFYGAVLILIARLARTGKRLA